MNEKIKMIEGGGGGTPAAAGSADSGADEEGAKP